MAYFFKYLASAVLSLFAAGAQAGYAQVAPPAGWSYAGGSSVGSFSPAAAANDVRYVANTVRTNAALNVAGRSVTMPASMRFAANAGRVAFTATRLNPLGLGLMAAAWLASECISSEGGEYHLTCGPDKKPIIPPQSGPWWDIMAGGYRYSTALEACEKAGGGVGSKVYPLNDAYGSYGCIGKNGITGQTNPERKCPDGWYVTPAGCVSKPPLPQLTPEEVAQRMEPVPIPDGLPGEIKTPLPVRAPVINPSPDNPDISIPYIVPVGDPVPTPDPNVWKQPVIRVVPSPTPDNPWRVDLQPDEILQPNSTPKTSDQLNPNSSKQPNPDAVGLCDQYPGIAACAPAAKPEEKKKFCEENPDLLVCQKEETPDVPDLEKKNIEMSFRPDSGWGSGGGSCPADKVLSHATLSFRPYCDFMSGIRPAIIAVAWFIGALILIGKR